MRELAIIYSAGMIAFAIILTIPDPDLEGLSSADMVTGVALWPFVAFGSILGYGWEASIHG